MGKAKVFWSGRSQAVRLPKEFRFDVDEVHISRRGPDVVLRPVAKDWAWLDMPKQPFDDDFVAATEEDPGEQQRPALDEMP